MDDIGRRGLIKGAALTAGAALVPAHAVSAQGAPHSPGGRVSGVYSDTLSDFGVRMGTDHRLYNDWPEAPHRTNVVPRMLVYSATGISRHAYLGAVLPPGLNPPLAADNIGQRAAVDWGTEAGLEVDWTEDVTVMGDPATLREYNTLVFLSNSRDILDDSAQTAVRQYMRSGGGFVSVHNTLGAEYNWNYFRGMLGGASFYDHAPYRGGTVLTVGRKDVSTSGLPRRWDFRDEWYNLDPLPSPLVRILAKTDTTAFEDGLAVGFGGHPGHAGDHPVSWCHYYDGGRAWVTSLGHDVGAWTGDLAGSEYFKEHVVNGILSTAGVRPFCR